MASKHTRRHLRDAWRPTILNRLGRDGWLAAGSPDLADRARAKARDILATHQVPDLPTAVASEAQALIAGFVEATA